MSTTDKAIETAKDAASHASDVAHQFVDNAKSVASDYAGRAQSAAGNIASQAKDYASTARSKASDLAHTVGAHPLTDTTAKIPTELFIAAAGASIAGSLFLKFIGRQKDADFVGHWAPTLISLGLLSKLIEHTRSASHESDRTPSGENL